MVAAHRAGPVVASAGTANVKMPTQAANVTQGALAARPPVVQQLAARAGAATATADAAARAAT